MNNTERNYRKSIGNKLKLARAKTDYTQEKLAEQLSLSARYISQLERGIAFGNATTIVNLCKALNINSDFLFSDIISSSRNNIDDIIDDGFLDKYLKLDDYNKQVINSMVKELLKLQNDSDSKMVQ